MTSTPPSDTANPSRMPSPPVVGPLVGVDMRRGSKWDTESGVQPGTVKSRLGGFIVEHDDGTASSYTIYGNEEVPGSVDDILSGYRDGVQRMIDALKEGVPVVTGNPISDQSIAMTKASADA